MRNRIFKPRIFKFSLVIMVILLLSVNGVWAFAQADRPLYDGDLPGGMVMSDTEYLEDEYSQDETFYEYNAFYDSYYYGWSRTDISFILLSLLIGFGIGIVVIVIMILIHRNTTPSTVNVKTYFTDAGVTLFHQVDQFTDTKTTRKEIPKNNKK